MGVGRRLHEGLGRRIRYLARLGLQHTDRRPWVWPVLGAALIGLWAVGTLLTATHGDPTAALDDAYIHFQFAKGFARLTPLVYSPGTPAVAGATSLLWPAVLAPLHAIGFRESAILWPAWTISFLCLGLLAYETARAAEGLLSREAALASGAMVLTFGGLVWCAGSGMEIVPFAWLLMRAARRLADWTEASSASPRDFRELLVLAWLAPLMRPEGALLTLMVVAGLGLAARGRWRWLSLLGLPAVLLPSFVNWLFSGSAGSTTTDVKWLFSSSHAGVGPALEITLDNMRHFFGTLLNGEEHSAMVVPRGSLLVTWLALPALLVAGFRRKRRARAIIVVALALLILVPCTYDTFLWNRLRYLWPFVPAWFVAVGAVADAAGGLLSRLNPALTGARALLAGAFLGTLIGYLPFSVQDLADSASGIQRQQVSLGRWAKTALPPQSRIGVNDTGAIAYYSDKSTFDIVGLTTAGEGRHWVAGPGSRFEHYERLGAERLPTHWIVYPDWLGVPQLFGAWLTERNVTDSGILGAARKVAYVASYAVLGSAERPEHAPGMILDRLDVADLDSEAEHRYGSVKSGATDSLLYGDGARLDGGRPWRRVDRFDLKLGRGPLLLRVASDERLTLRVACAGRSLGRIETSGAGWEELTFELPADVPTGLQRIEIAAEPGPDAAGAPSDRPEADSGPSFAALHYWSVR